MGQPKLLMPWQASDDDTSDEQTAVGEASDDATAGGETTRVIDCVLRTWTRSLAERVAIVVRPDDAPLQSVGRRWAVDVVIPSGPTRDMKASIRWGMQHLRATYQPADDDWCFLAPADLPTLETQVINTMVAAEKDPRQIAVPVYGEKVSHPVLFPWSIMQTIDQLDDDQGVDHLVARSATTKIRFPVELRPQDIDTPDEYQHLRRASNRSRPSR